LRRVWFSNEQTAALSLPEENPCLTCRAKCEEKCARPGEVPIRETINRLYYQVRPECETPLPEDEARLACDLCGIPMENPFMLSSSVVASTYDMCARAFEAGWAGVCFKTICSLDIREASPRFSAIRGSDGGIIGFKNIEQLSDHSVAENMEIFRRLKQNYPGKVILASIMGKDEEEWGELARECEANGADAVELNFSCPNMMEEGFGSDIGQIPELVERYTAAAKRACGIPVLAKLTPNVDRMGPAAEAAIRGGADGIAAINTIKSIVGVNIHTYVTAPAVHGRSAVGGYSGNAVKPIALRFIAELGQGIGARGKHISAMGGIETWRDALEFLLLGGGTIQVTTAVMQYGYRIIDDLKAGLNLYLKEKGFSNVREVIGLGLDTVSGTTDVLERGTVIYPQFETERCIGCGRCAISCMDGGHQAIRLDESRRPKLNGAKCVGCHLCVLVCPQGAVVPGTKRVVKRF
jgi:dihydropyrimidine dehydrogenase (NAD+) subunit PreA